MASQQKYYRCAPPTIKDRLMNEHSKHLNLRILPQSGEFNCASVVAWNALDELGAITGRGVSSIAELSADYGNVIGQCAVSVLIPGLDVLLCQVPTPTTNSRQLRRALPFLVEDLLADELENVHLALPEPLDLSSGEVDVMVISHRLLIHYLDILHSNQLSPDRVCPDILAVPRLGNGWSVLIDGQDIIIRSGDMAGMVAVVDDLEMVFSSLMAQAAPIDYKAGTDAAPYVGSGLLVTLIACEGEAESVKLAAAIASFLRDNYEAVEVRESLYRESVSELLLASYLGDAKLSGETGIANFLQGGYRTAQEHGGSWQQWQPLAAVATVGLVAFLLFSVASGWYFSGKAEVLEEQNIALYKQLFPNERRIVSPRKQFQNHLRQVGDTAADGSFLPLLTKFSGSAFAVSDNGKRGAADISIVKLRYEHTVDGLQLELQSKTIDQLDRLKTNLAKVGLAATVNSATEQGDTMLSRLVVERL